MSIGDRAMAAVFSGYFARARTILLRGAAVARMLFLGTPLGDSGCCPSGGIVAARLQPVPAPPMFHLAFSSRRCSVGSGRLVKTSGA
jgi:hypothetical protein